MPFYDILSKLLLFACTIDCILIPMYVFIMLVSKFDLPVMFVCQRETVQGIGAPGTSG